MLVAQGAANARVETTSTEESALRSVSPRTLSLSPDGRYLAFVAEPIANNSLEQIEPRQRGRLVLRDLAQDSTQVELPIEFELAALNQAWSPDSRRLAFFAVAHDASRLHVYDTKSGAVRVFGITACSWSTCAVAAPQWSGDGSYLFSIGPSRSSTSTSSTPDTPRPSADVREYYSPITTSSSVEGPGPSQALHRVDVASGNTDVLYEQPGIASFHMSADGNRIAVVSHDPLSSARVGEVVYEVTRLDRRTRLGRSSWAATHLSPRLVMLYGRAASISAPGRHLAYVESSGGGAGDVHVLDLDSAINTNVTANVAFLHEEATQGKNERRFSRDYLPPLWSRDSSCLYVTRTVATDDVSTPYQTAIWAVSLTGAPARRVTALDQSILGFASCGGDTPCLDDKDRVVAAIRRSADRTTAVGTLSLRSGAFASRFESGVSPLGETEQFIDDNVHAVPMVGTRDLIFASLDESVDSPPDIVVSSLGNDSAQRLGILNSDHKGTRQVKLQNVEWTSETFGRGRALLAMPRKGATRDTRLVVHIYWSFAGYSREPFEQYDGGAAAWRPLVTDGDFAVLVPEVPMPTESSRGRACSQVAMRVDEAVEHAVAATGLPRDRIGLYGYSWGGYLANCIAARSVRYAAVVSGAGFSDMFGFCLNESLCMSAPRALGLPNAPWLAIDEFVAESPALSAHTVRAPMLLQFGSADGEVLQIQMREMFYALQIAGKSAQLNIYEGRNHSTTVTHPEYWPRTIEWLDRYLRH